MNLVYRAWTREISRQSWEEELPQDTLLSAVREWYLQCLISIQEKLFWYIKQKISEAPSPHFEQKNKKCKRNEDLLSCQSKILKSLPGSSIHSLKKKVLSYPARWSAGKEEDTFFNWLNLVSQWFPILDNPGVLGLQLPETLAWTVGGEGFWELHSKNIWVTHCWESLF